MMYAKVVRRIVREPNAKGTEHSVYDVYVDVGFFSPLIKKWEILKSSLTREELMKYMIIWLADTYNSKIYVTADDYDRTRKGVTTQRPMRKAAVWGDYPLQ